MRLAEIEILRAVAIILTLIAHLGFFTPVMDPWFLIIVTKVGQCWGGVDLFFCISGFVIARLLWPQIESAPTGQHQKTVLKKFFIHRAFRILPLAVFWASFVLFCAFFLNKSGVFGVPKETFRHFIASIFFFENIYLTFNMKLQLAAYWSLSIEEQFYLVFPFFLIVVPARWRVPLLIAFTVIQVLLPRPVDQSKLITMMRYDAILMGVLIYRWSLTAHFERMQVYARDCPALLRTLFFILLAAVVLIPIQMKFVWFHIGLLDMACAAIVILAVFQTGALVPKKPLVRSVLNWFASRSFSLYLAHMPMIFLSKELAAQTGLALVPQTLADMRVGITFTLIFCAAEIMHRALEQPLRQYGKKLV